MAGRPAGEQQRAGSVQALATRIGSRPWTTEEPADLDEVIRDVDVDVTDPSSWLELFAEAAESLAAGFIARLPLIALGDPRLIFGLLAVRFAVRWTEMGLRRGRADVAVQRLVGNLLRVLLVCSCSSSPCR
jgi:hypothetical protein